MRLSHKWRRADLNNLTLDLVDPKGVETLSFYQDGNVIATVGQRGGPIAGPVFRWRIDKHGVLFVGDKDSGYGRFRKRCEDEQRVLVDMGGRTFVEFKKSKGR